MAFTNIDKTTPFGDQEFKCNLCHKRVGTIDDGMTHMKREHPAKYKELVSVLLNLRFNPS